MRKPGVEWDPSWDEDWMAEQGKLEEEVEDEHPRKPEEAVELYRYGFSVAKAHPGREWSDVESELYQDYMTGAPEPGQEGIPLPEEDWESRSGWARSGWEAGRR